MIISRTPFRISFCGGGTDLKSFYSNGYGAVVSTAINKYMYITVNKMFSDSIRICYSKTENVNNFEDIQHPLVREAMRLTGVTEKIVITSIADIPSRGSGLGSSSSYTVGLLKALYAYQGKHKSAETLAKEACKIEIDIVKDPIGKQDQYAAAYGGFNFIRFNPDENVFVDPIICKNSTRKALEDNLIMFYTGITRKAPDILKEQRARTSENMDILIKMRDLAIELKESLNNDNLTRFGELLHKNWLLKKTLTNNISNNEIDNLYNKAIKAGASGGKILGAGGGGFLLFYCEQKKQDKVRESLNSLREETFKFDMQGSKIIYVEE